MLQDFWSPKWRANRSASQAQLLMLGKLGQGRAYDQEHYLDISYRRYFVILCFLRPVRLGNTTMRCGFQTVEAGPTGVLRIDII